jgi:hypothetical protein
MEELQRKQSIGFLGYRFPKDSQYILPPVRVEGQPMNLIGGQNLYNFNGMLKTFPGLEKLFPEPLGQISFRRILGMFPFVYSDGTIYFIICTARKIYSYKAGDSAAADITGAITLTGGNSDYFDAEYWVDTATGYDPIIILCNGIDAQFEWTGTGNCSAVAGSPPISSYLDSFAGHVFASFVLSGAVYYGQRDQRSNIDDNEDWAAGTAGSVDLRQDAGDIQGSLVFGEFRYIFKEESITLCRSTGSDPPFAYDQQFLPIGAMAGRSILKIWRHELGVFLGNDLNVYVLRRDGAYEVIGDDIVYRIRSYANDENLRYSFSVYLPAIDHVVLFIPTTNDSDAFCDTAFAFNFGEYVRSGMKIWSPPINIGVDMSVGASAKFRSAYTIAQLGELYGTIADIPGTIGSLFQDATFSEVLLGDRYGYIWKLNEVLDTFPVETTGTSLVTGDDTDFDTIGNWTASVGAVSSVAGGNPGNCMKVLNDTLGAAQQTADLPITDLTPGKIYKLLFDVKSDGVMTEDIEWRTTGETAEVAGTVAITAAWVSHELIFQATYANTNLQVRPDANTADTEFFLIDNVTLQDVTHVDTIISWEADFGQLQLAQGRGEFFRLQEHEIDYRDGTGLVKTNRIYDEELAKIHEISVTGTGLIAMLEQRFWGTEEGRF